MMESVLAHRVAGAPLAWWLGFHIFAAVLLTADLVRPNAEQKLSVSLRWAAAWMAFAAALGAVIYVAMGRSLAVQFASAYVLEQVMSVDNLFLFIVIFSTFGIAAAQQHRILFWGVLGAIAMRAVLLLTGIQLLARFHFLEYVFGVIVLVSGIWLLTRSQKQSKPGWFDWLLRRFPVATGVDYQRLVLRRNGRWQLTAALLALMAIEVTDLVFALDSIPAVLALSRDAFVVYTSNILAVLSLRSLFPAVVSMVERLRFMHAGVAVILCFVGAKMLLSERYPLSAERSLATIIAVLAVVTTASLAFPRKNIHSSNNLSS